MCLKTKEKKNYQIGLKEHENHSKKLRRSKHNFQKPKDKKFKKFKKMAIK